VSQSQVNNVFTGELASGTAEQKVLTASADLGGGNLLALSTRPTVTFIAGAVNLTESTVAQTGIGSPTADPAAAAATFLVTLYDGQGNPVGGANISGVLTPTTGVVGACLNCAVVAPP